MPLDENEDPEVLLEHEQFVQSNRRMRKIAAWSGKISLYAVGVAMLSLFLYFYNGGFFFRFPDDPPAKPVAAFFEAVGGISLVIVCPLAALVDWCLVIRLAFRGERGLKTLLLMGLPGAFLSTVIVGDAIWDIFLK